jgi:hypothetical protein
MKKERQKRERREVQKFAISFSLVKKKIRDHRGKLQQNEVQSLPIFFLIIPWFASLVSQH